MNSRALANIMDDLAKLKLTEEWKITPSKPEIQEHIAELEKHMGKDKGFFKTSAPNSEDQLNLASAASLAWQRAVGQMFMPNVSASAAETKRELENLSLLQGLPIKLTLIRTGACLDKDNSTKITALEYDLEPAIRQAVYNLPENKWSAETNGDRFMICSRSKTKEYARAEKFAEQQAQWKRALFDADQRLKDAKRRAIVIIMDDKLK